MFFFPYVSVMLLTYINPAGRFDQIVNAGRR
jgi:hypothetical protein